MPNCTPNINIVYDGSNPLSLPTSVNGVSLPLYSFHANQQYCTKYGQTQKFDIILPENSGDNCPLVIYIHGGGFFGNNKNSAYSSSIKKKAISYLLGSGIAFASINYYLLKKIYEPVGIVKSLYDCVSALQHFRNWSNQYRLDPNKIGLVGSSAGAGTALWIGFHKEMRDQFNPEPIYQQSTRVKAVVALNTQATYDLRDWHSGIFNNNLLEGDVYGLLGGAKLNSYYLVPSTFTLPNQIRNFITNYFSTSLEYKGDDGVNIDMLSLMSKNDPSFWVECLNPDWSLSTNFILNKMNHHPLHSEALYNKAISMTGLGTLDVIARIPNRYIDNRSIKGYTDGEWYHFIADKLNSL